MGPDGKQLANEFGVANGRPFSPIWTNDETANWKIQDRYHDAAFALAKCSFFRNTWDADFDESKFLMIRDEWIKACEAGRVHDWQGDRDSHRLRQSFEKQTAELGKATRRFRRALVIDRYGELHKLEAILRAAFEGRQLDETEILHIASPVGPDAVISALDRFADECETPRGRGLRFFGYGPIVYRRLPRRLPDPKVALAVQLADIFSCLRPDTPTRIRHNGREPTFSDGTPWRQLGGFVDAAFGNKKHVKNLQKRAKTAVDAGLMIYSLSHGGMKTT
ncbi:MAG: hypothetical protein AB7V46_18560 [Thermomicrobiales bacterium]